MTNSKRTIGKLAAEAGVGVETIRYYERRGLLQQPRRRGTARTCGDDALWRLRYRPRRPTLATAAAAQESVL
jgi:MerR family regulatory protein